MRARRRWETNGLFASIVRYAARSSCRNRARPLQMYAARCVVPFPPCPSERPQERALREQDSSQRITNFNEVNLGYSKEEALKEASRCLQCKDPKCMEGCPVNINIPSFINNLKKEKFGLDLLKLFIGKDTSNILKSKYQERTDI